MFESPKLQNMSDQSLEKLKKELEAVFEQLPLVNRPEDIVHGEGTIEAQVMMIGEAPGYHESVQRRPFVGRSGQLLRKVIAQVGLQPEQVFISNIVKVRPPENRDPTPSEIESFKKFLDREIELIDPKLIVTLGRYSMYKFLPNVRISQVHGRLHKLDWAGNQRFILPMYHPAAALRGTRVKDIFIEDFEKISKIIEWLESKPNSKLDSSAEVEDSLDFEQDLKEALF